MDARADRPPHRHAAAEAAVYSRFGRVLAGTLATLGWGSAPAILTLVVVATDPPVMPPDLVRLVAVLVALPAVVVRLMRRRSQIRFGVQHGLAVLERRDLRVEIPCASVAGVIPWVLPAPEPGFSLRMRSGRRLGYGLGASDPLPFLQALTDGGTAAASTSHPAMLYAAARDRSWRTWHFLHYAVKFGLFPLLPAAVLFNAHQHIAYGGTFGQYYLVGLGAYVDTFAVYWVTTLMYLVLWARSWRVLGESAALLAAWTAPRVAGTARRALEVACAAIYYAGVPALLAVRFLI